MKRVFTFIFTILYVSIFAQPASIGTDCGGGSGYTYTNHALTDKGAFRQKKVQENFSTAAGSRKWEFNADSYFNTWRAPSGTAIQISGHNTVVAPSSSTASAFFRANFGGGDGARMKATTNGNFYFFNITDGGNYVNQYMSILETTFDPVSLNAPTRSPAGTVNANVSVVVTVTTSANPSSGENVYLRYTTDNYTTSTLVAFTFTGSTGTATIPGLPQGTTVNYYCYSSPSSKTAIDAEVTSNGQRSHDLMTLNLSTGDSYLIDVALSADFLNFNVSKLAGASQLSWQTASEKNNAQFNIQRSTNNQVWQTIGSVKATNNPSGAQYNFTDEAPLSNINYYRLQMVDNEGKVTYSKVVSVSGNDAKKSLAVYPNPVKAELNVVTDGQATGVSIFDMTGKSVLQFNDNRTKVNVQDLPNGVYFMRLLDKNNLLGEPVRFVKQ